MSSPPPLFYLKDPRRPLYLCLIISISQSGKQMDFCPSECPPEKVCSKLGSYSTALDELFPTQNMEVDVSLEWPSAFVEDCLSCTEICIPPPVSVTPASLHHIQNTRTSPLPKSLEKPHNILTLLSPSSVQEFSVPGRARSKRKRTTSYSSINSKKTSPFSILSNHLNKEQHVTTCDLTLLQQTYWLADSELFVPKTDETTSSNNRNRSGDEEIKQGEHEYDDRKEEYWGRYDSIRLKGPKRCSHCLNRKTPQWRAGPSGPKTLCNACGVRFKSGKLHPEYRPAKSPTFVSYKHSNSHKKVMEMRMTTAPPSNVK